MNSNTRKYFFITTLVVFILAMAATTGSAFIPQKEVVKASVKKTDSEKSGSKEVSFSSMEDAVVPFFVKSNLFKALWLIAVLVVALIIIKGQVRPFAYRFSYLKKLNTSCLAINAP